MSFKLSTPKPLNKNISKVWITTNDEEPLYLETEKCYSYGVKRNEKFNPLPMSLILDGTTKQKYSSLNKPNELIFTNSYYDNTLTTTCNTIKSLNYACLVHIFRCAVVILHRCYIVVVILHHYLMSVASSTLNSSVVNKISMK